ncbi:hypothetical protein [Sphingomonas sp. GB1N7]|uniref:hypothetical protein n=1 Tax=Parasphingomonas caseinilytica TaxID=3096158 RepID=UPI002FCB1CA7
MKYAAALLSLVLLAAPADAAKKTKIVEPLPTELIGHATVAATTVIIGETAQQNFEKLEAKAANKNTGTPAESGSPDARATTDRYSTLPFAKMLPLVIEDVTREWGLTSGRPIKLVVTIDSIKTANAGMAMLLGSNDELAGTVVVADAVSGDKLGEIYVDVLNSSAGLLGLAIRGAGVREKLTTAFAGQIAMQLSGSKHKPKVAAK